MNKDFFEFVDDQLTAQEQDGLSMEDQALLNLGLLLLEALPEARAINKARAMFGEWLMASIPGGEAEAVALAQQLLQSLDLFCLKAVLETEEGVK